VNIAFPATVAAYGTTKHQVLVIIQLNVKAMLGG
jgi:hypothetical protein